MQRKPLVDKKLIPERGSSHREAELAKALLPEQFTETFIHRLGHDQLDDHALEVDGADDLILCALNINHEHVNRGEAMLGE